MHILFASKRYDSINSYLITLIHFLTNIERVSSQLTSRDVSNKFKFLIELELEFQATHIVN